MKARTIKRSIKDEGLAEIFNQMLGTGDSMNVNICYTKYNNIRINISKMLEIFEIFADSGVLSSDDLSIARDDIKVFVEHSRKEMEDYFSIDLSHHEVNLNVIDEEERKAFAEKYEAMKSSDLVRTFIKICDNLFPHKVLIRGKNPKLFLLNFPTGTFAPLPFTNLNFKYLAEQFHNNEKESDLIVVILQKSLDYSFAIFDDYRRPEVDVDEFVEVIMRNIGEVEKHIPRCDKAFKKIKKSVKLLKGNFGDYYRDFVESKNQMIIMENFVRDVADSTETDADTVRQFRQIIQYYKKVSQQQGKMNPTIQKLFNKVDDQMKELDKHENLAGAKSLDDEAPAAPKKSAEPKIDPEVEQQNAEYMEKSVDQILAESGLGGSRPNPARKARANRKKI